jgi:hypothetical protein
MARGTNRTEKQTMRINHSAAVAVVILCVASSAPRAQRENPPTIVVPREMRSIQAAVDAIPDGGRIVVQPGRYEEVVFIRNKTVHLVGEDRPQWVGPAPERVVKAEDVVGLVNYSAGGGGSIRGFRFIGGDAAIVAFDQRSPSGPIAVFDTSIQGSGRGILVASTGLEAKNVMVSNSLLHAIGLKQVTKLHLDAVNVVQNGGVGIFVVDSGCDCTQQVCLIEHTFVEGNVNGGILALRSGLCISWTHILNNRIFGLQAVGSAVRLRHFGIAHTKPRIFDGLWGDGIIAMPDSLPSTVTVSGGYVLDSSRAGIASIGSLIKVKNTLAQCSGFDLSNESVVANAYGPGRPLTNQPGLFENYGGNQCGCPLATGVCVSQSVGLSPPPPLTENDL